jgi:hypothetical protein
VSAKGLATNNMDRSCPHGRVGIVSKQPFAEQQLFITNHSFARCADQNKHGFADNQNEPSATSTEQESTKTVISVERPGAKARGTIQASLPPSHAKKHPLSAIIPVLTNPEADQIDLESASDDDAPYMKAVPPTSRLTLSRGGEGSGSRQAVSTAVQACTKVQAKVQASILVTAQIKKLPPIVASIAGPAPSKPVGIMQVAGHHDFTGAHRRAPAAKTKRTPRRRTPLFGVRTAKG